MDINKLTIRSQEALAAAQKLAGDLNHQQVESPHLLRALLGEPEGVVYPLLQKLGAQPQTLRARVDAVLDGQAKVYGQVEIYLGAEPEAGTRGRLRSGRAAGRRLRLDRAPSAGPSGAG